MTEFEVEQWLPQGTQPVMVGHPRKGLETVTYRLSTTWWANLAYDRPEEASPRTLATTNVGLISTADILSDSEPESMSGPPAQVEESA